MPELPDRRVLEEAADWFALLGSNQVTDQDRARWRAWLGRAGSPQSLAWQRVQVLSSQFGVARDSAAQYALQDELGKRRRAIRSLLLLAGVGLGTWGAVSSRPWQTWTADYASGVGELRQLALPDGTQLWLNTDSAIRLQYTGEERGVQLLYGEVHIVTAHPDGESRPFVLMTRDGTARALGTRYSVRLRDDTTDVAVYEGAVALRPRQAAADALIVPAGRRATMSSAAAYISGAADAAGREWTRGVLLARDVPLGEFIAELARYRPGYLGCAPEVANLRLVGGFPAQDTDLALEQITKTLPVEVRRRSRWWVTVVPRP